MAFFCPTCGEEQILPPLIIIGQGPCLYCGTIVDLTNAITDFDEAFRATEQYDSSGMGDEYSDFLKKKQTC